MPTEYLGLVTDAPQAPPAAASALIPKQAAVQNEEAARMVAEARAAASAPAMTNGSPLYSRAIQLAKSSPDFGTFVTNALADSEILADEELAIQCADESLIWAAAHSS